MGYLPVDPLLQLIKLYFFCVLQDASVLNLISSDTFLQRQAPSRDSEDRECGTICKDCPKVITARDLSLPLSLPPSIFPLHSLHMHVRMPRTLFITVTPQVRDWRYSQALTCTMLFCIQNLRH